MSPPTTVEPRYDWPFPAENGRPKIDPADRKVQLAALLDKVASELAFGHLGEMTDVVIFLRGERCALVCVDGDLATSSERADKLLRQGVAFNADGTLEP